MKKFEAPTLEEAYAEAAKSFSCSVTELEIQVVQHPSRGFLGFGRKSAIIVAAAPAQERKRTKKTPSAARHEEREEARTRKAEPAESIETAEPATEPEAPRTHDEKVRERAVAAAAEAAMAEVMAAAGEVDESTEEAPAEEREERTEPTQEERRTTEKTQPREAVSERRVERPDKIFDNFYNETPDIHSVVPEIAEKLETLFSHACFDLEPVDVSAYDEETVLVEFNGNDAALLIGKEGYRYKALASLLYNWIHGTYGFRVRLEIAEFLKNQETMIENYLEPIIERVENEGRAQTKVLDGILVQIALKQLRERFPEKYVAVRTNREGGRYIIVNERQEKR